MASADLLAWAQKVRADFDKVSANLLDLDADPTTKLLTAGGLSGSSEAPAKAATAALDRLWALLPVIRSPLDSVLEEQAKGRKADDDRIRHLLTTPTVPIDGTLLTPSQPATVTLTVADAMNMLVADFATAADVIDRVGTAWRDGVPTLDSARLRLDQMLADVGEFPEAEVTRSALERANAAAAADPLQLGALLPPLRTALASAETACAMLVARRDGLRRELDEAAAQLARIEASIREGTVALDETRAKVADPAGLLAPLDPIEVLDGMPRGLTPWLERLRRTAGTDWRAAVNGLVAWRGLAEGIEVTAEQIRQANRAPLDRRNELRGLLGGLAAKAAAAGRAEDPELSALHQQARDLLYQAPCDLAAAVAAVDAFAAAVNRRTSRPTEDRA